MTTAMATPTRVSSIFRNLPMGPAPLGRFRDYASLGLRREPPAMKHDVHDRRLSRIERTDPTCHVPSLRDRDFRHRGQSAQVEPAGQVADGRCVADAHPVAGPKTGPG